MMKIAIMGNMNPGYEPHFKMDRCFKELQQVIPFNFEWVPTQNLEKDAGQILKSFNGIIAGSGPYQSKDGIINGIRYARQNNIPFLGTCSGFGYAILEFGQYLFQLPNVYHPYEMVEHDGPILLQPLNQCGGEMHTIIFEPVHGSLTAQIYNETEVTEQSHCTYGIDAGVIERFEKACFAVSGYDKQHEAKIMEYKCNDFFVVTLFLPQFNSSIINPHSLFTGFLKASHRKFTSVKPEAIGSYSF